MDEQARIRELEAIIAHCPECRGLGWVNWSLDKRDRANRVRFAEKQQKMGKKWLQVVPSACFWPL